MIEAIEELFGKLRDRLDSSTRTNVGFLDERLSEIRQQLIRISNENRASAFDAQMLDKMDHNICHAVKMIESMRGTNPRAEMEKVCKQLVDLITRCDSDLFARFEAMETGLNNAIRAIGEETDEHRNEINRNMGEYYRVQITRLARIEERTIELKNALIRHAAGQLALTAFAVINFMLLLYILMKGNI